MPIILSDPMGLAATDDSNNGASSQDCKGENCKQSYLDCLGKCIESCDPLNANSKIGLTMLGGTFWKSWIGLPRGFAGASPLTTIPSAGAHFLGGGGAGTLGGFARATGRIFSPLWIAYGDYLFAMEVYCAISCANNKCAH